MKHSAGQGFNLCPEGNESANAINVRQLLSPLRLRHYLNTFWILNGVQSLIDFQVISQIHWQHWMHGVSWIPILFIYNTNQKCRRTSNRQSRIRSVVSFIFTAKWKLCLFSSWLKWWEETCPYMMQKWRTCDHSTSGLLILTSPKIYQIKVTFCF